MAKKIKTKKVAKKGFWEKLSYPQRGGLIGTILGLILFIILHKHYLNAVYTFGLGSVITRLFPLFLIELALPLVYGLMMGSIYNKISKTKFLIILVITIPLLALLVAILILSVARPY